MQGVEDGGSVMVQAVGARRERRVCVGCGACCRWPGYVRLAAGEAERIASFLGLPVYAFTERYSRVTGDRRGLSLIEQADGACVFLTTAGTCAIHAVKPAQCVGFPNEWSFEGFERFCRSQVTKHEEDLS